MDAFPNLPSCINSEKPVYFPVQFRSNWRPLKYQCYLIGSNLHGHISYCIYSKGKCLLGHIYTTSGCPLSQLVAHVIFIADEAVWILADLSDAFCRTLWFKSGHSYLFLKKMFRFFPNDNFTDKIMLPLPFFCSRGRMSIKIVRQNRILRALHVESSHILTISVSFTTLHFASLF